MTINHSKGPLVRGSTRLGWSYAIASPPAGLGLERFGGLPEEGLPLPGDARTKENAAGSCPREILLYNPRLG